ncbi:6-phosphogluconate dehydrogenase, decarboxylating 1, chloroplastic-like [Cornus florida]|uniref:6-phosphogluconate dehydrogenase, decarboxylating 1, chloroplastic-like n=1 Tax=Cornus florida TaxID=4283 RepID=UPI0028A0746F|nr:6-phosphogluconate dehydrogenase, decarboxylating 1, chloroplastic-like [Cornus florida]
MDARDTIINGGNEWYENTERRILEVADKGILYLGMGIFGGEEGARHGPSLMPGGSYQAYPCVTCIGEGGSGNFLKMIVVFRDAVVADYYRLNNGRETWDVQFHRQFHDWELLEVLDFLAFIHSQVGVGVGMNEMLWVGTSRGVFEVKSFYNYSTVDLLETWKGVQWRAELKMLEGPLFLYLVGLVA